MGVIRGELQPDCIRQGGGAFRQERPTDVGDYSELGGGLAPADVRVVREAAGVERNHGQASPQCADPSRAIKPSGARER